MATIRVTHNIGDLASEAAAIPARMVREGNKVVRKNVRQGNALARSNARASSGIHGLNAFKRITSEMTGALSGEYGWTGDASNVVGAGWRNGAGNTDLERAQDVQGPKFAKDVGDMAEDLFW